MIVWQQPVFSKILSFKDSGKIETALSCFHQLKLQGLQRLWTSFGNGEHRRWFPIHNLATSLGQEKCKGLPFFHAFCGYDPVSGFTWKGKSSFFQFWNSLPDITETFLNLSKFSTSVDGDDIQKLEHLVALSYNMTNHLQLQCQLIPPGKSSPEFWGWDKKAGGDWAIHWTDLSPIPDVFKELCKCSCKKECSGRWSCKK